MQNTNPLTGEKNIVVKDKKSKRLKTKHAASKKGYAHKHNLSRGQLNHLKFIGK